MSFGEDQPMDIDVDEQELQRNRQEESALSAISNIANSDSTGDCFTKEKDLSPLTPKLVQALYSEDVTIQIQAARKICKLVSDTPNPLRDEIIKSGTVPRFVHFLEDTRYPKLQFKSVCVLINIALGTSAQIQSVIDGGAVPVLIRLLTTSSDETVIQKSLWVLGKIAKESPQNRDFLLKSNLLPPLLGLFNDNLSTSVVHHYAFILKVLCRNTDPPPNFEQVSQCLPLLARLMVNEDEKVLEYVCQALSRLSYGSNEQIQVVIESGVCPRAVQLLSHTSTNVVKAALCLVSNITTGTVSQTQVLINENALPALRSLLSHEMEFIVEDACWSLANIATRTEQQIQAIIDANIIPSLIELLRHRDLQIRHVAACVIANATSNGTEEQIVYIVETGAIAPLCKLLTETDTDLLQVVLTCLENILITGESVARTTGSTVNLFANLINSDAVPRFVHFLEDTRYPKLQFESAWVLAYITGGNSAQTQVVIDAEAVPVLIKLLTTSQNENVLKKSVLALGNIARASTESRDLVLNSNVLPPLLGLFNDGNLSTSMMRKVTWTLARLCHAKNSPPNFAQVSQCLPLLVRLMVNEDATVLTDACQTLSRLSDGPNEQIQAVIDSGVCPRAVQLLSHTSTNKQAVPLTWLQMKWGFRRTMQSGPQAC